MDRAFMAQDPDDDWSLVRTILTLAEVLGIEAIAEGIEHEWQRRQLHGFECRLGQGFHLGRPVNAAEFSRLWLTETPSRPTTALSTSR